MANITEWYATGRRKTASARVRLRPGSGKITVNGHEVNDYFGRPTSVMILTSPLTLTEVGDKFDLVIRVSGGGKTGQAGAVLHGIARALCEFDAELRPTLKAAGMLTRDSRAKERKKYGLAGARRRFQFSKR